jgi:hypothetical protein
MTTAAAAASLIPGGVGRGDHAVRERPGKLGHVRQISTPNGCLRIHHTVPFRLRTSTGTISSLNVRINGGAGTLMIKTAIHRLLAGNA